MAPRGFPVKSLDSSGLVKVNVMWVTCMSASFCSRGRRSRLSHGGLWESAVGSHSLKFWKWLPEWRPFENAPVSVFSVIGINDRFPKREVTAHGGRSRYDCCPCKRQIWILLLNHLEQEPLPAICWGRQVMLMWARRCNPVLLPQIRLQLLRFDPPPQPPPHPRRSNSKSQRWKH